jgi:2'-5' RNA ligase
MSAIVSIELLLDPETEARVRADWERLAAAGLPSLAAHHSPSSRPHVTLLVRSDLEPVAFSDAAALLPVSVVLASPIVFRHGDRGVLAWGVEPTEELLRLHRVVHRAAPHGVDAPHTTPGNWTPHVTLARRLRVDDLAVALDLLPGQHVGRGVDLRRWDSASATVTPLP